MRKLLIAVIALGLAFGMNASAFAVGIPFCPPPASPNAPVTFACVNVNGQIFSAPITPAAKGSSAELHVLRPGNFKIDLTVFLNPDPAITYAFTVGNFTPSPLPFSLIFGTPIVPVGSPNQVRGTLAGSLTDTSGGLDGVTVSPTGSNIAAYSVSADGGATLTPMGVDVGLTGSGIGGIGLYFYGPYDSGLQPGPLGNSWNFLRADLNFLVSVGDFVSLNGSGTIMDPPAVPEPGMLLLLGSGLAVLGISVRKRLPRS